MDKQKKEKRDTNLLAFAKHILAALMHEPLRQELVKVPETDLLPEVRVQLAVESPLVVPRLLGIGVRLMHQEILR